MIRGFLHDGLIVSVDAPDEELIWLEHFLDPAYAVVAVPRDSVRVTSEPGRCPPMTAQSTDARVAFAFDQGPIRLPESPIPDGARLHDVAGRLVFEVRWLGRDVRLVYCGDRLDARLRLMRVVREFAHNHSLGTGGVILHAAAVTVDGAAVAIAGPKGAGKTTLAVRLLAVPGVDYLSNDRLLVRTEIAESPLAFGIPTVIALRPDTRDLVPELGARLRPQDDPHRTSRQLANVSDATVTRTETWYISPPTLCRAVDRSLQANAPLAAVLFPAGDRAAGRKVRRLSRFEAAARLRDSLLGSPARTYTSEVFVATSCAAVEETHLHGACAALASRVSCFECVLPDGASIEDRAALLSACLS